MDEVAQLLGEAAARIEVSSAGAEEREDGGVGRVGGEGSVEEAELSDARVSAEGEGFVALERGEAGISGCSRWLQPNTLREDRYRKSRWLVTGVKKTRLTRLRT